MAMVFAGWQNANEQRNYPLHDMASKQGVDGTLLPDGIIADLNIMVPQSAGRFVFISSLAITPGIVSITFLATDTDPFAPGAVVPTSFVPLAAISVVRPVTLYKNYPITAIYPGVAGWIAFGSDAEEITTLSLRFALPTDALLNSKAARSYRDYPITSLGKYGRVTELTGLVRLLGTDDVVIEKAVRTINGRKKEVVAIGLDMASEAADTLRKYAGTCGTRPEDGTCAKGKPLIVINGVTPDCEGNIDIVFEGLDVEQTGVPGGMVIDLPVGLDDVCPTFDPARYDPNDLCVSSSSSSSSESSESPAPEPSSSSEAPTPTYDTYYDDFSDPVTTFTFMIPQEGTWGIKDVELTEAISGISRLYCDDSDVPSVIVVPQVPKLATIGYNTFGVIRPFSDAANGFVIFGYKGTDDFWYAGASFNTVDAEDGKLFVGHKTGDLGSSLDNWPAGLEFGYQFDSHGMPNLDTSGGLISPTGIFGSDIKVNVIIEPVVSDSMLSRVTIEWYWNRSGQGHVNPASPFNTVVFVTGFDLSGLCGLGAVACETHFDSFGIFNL